MHISRSIWNDSRTSISWRRSDHRGLKAHGHSPTTNESTARDFCHRFEVIHTHEMTKTLTTITKAKIVQTNNCGSCASSEAFPNIRFCRRWSFDRRRSHRCNKRTEKASSPLRSSRRPNRQKMNTSVASPNISPVTMLQQLSGTILRWTLSRTLDDNVVYITLWEAQKPNHFRCGNCFRMEFSSWMTSLYSHENSREIK